MRVLDNKNYYFENNKEILFIKEMKSKFISKLSQIKNLNNKFITLDVETYIKDSILIVYCISIFDGKNISSYYLSDFKNSEELIISALNSILIRKYNGYNVYIHNLAKFDIIFLLKYLVKVATLKPVIHNGRIISLMINYGKNNEYSIQFKDSYLLLLSSLMNLSKAFGITNPKSIFPFHFVNKDNLNYIGEVPDFSYFNKISNNEYQNYKKRSVWNLKLEAIKYCELDCISLYQVLTKFNCRIFI